MSALSELLRDTAVRSRKLPTVRRADLIATAVWYIWWERRKATRGEAVLDPARSAQSISALALNYSRAYGKRKAGIKRHGWTKPVEDFVKLNVDASFDIDSGRGGSGAIIRDDHGGFVAGGCWTIPFVEDAATAEAIAIYGMDSFLPASWGATGSWLKLIAWMWCRSCKKEEISSGQQRLIFEECTFLCRNFTRAMFNHCPREANRAAHCLDKFGEDHHNCLWESDPPDFLIHVVTDDVTLLPD